MVPVTVWDDTLLQLAGRVKQEWLVVNAYRLEVARLLRLEQFEKQRRERQRLASGAARPSPIRLPSSYVGSKAYFAAQRDDAFTVASRYGNPDLFITVTMDPNHPAVRAAFGGRAARAPYDFPEVLTQVFMEIVRTTLEMLDNGELFGIRALWWIAVIEWQKRGPPHVHIAVMLPGFLRTAAFIDRYISATVPPPGDPLRDVVLKYQQHKCNKDSVCWEGGDKCKRGFPQPLSPVTYEDAHGQIRYKRVSEADRRVVPYCPPLLSLLRSHQCVEVCLHGPGCVAYLLNYTLKGADKSLVESVERRAAQRARDTNEPRNYIQEHLEMRTLGAFEAAFHALGHRTVQRSFTTVTLPVHLSDKEAENQRMVTSANRGVLQYSLLQRYFARHDSLRALLALEWAEQYVLRDEPRRLDVVNVTAFVDKLSPPKYHCRRQRTARIVAAALTRQLPVHGERQFMRLLLLERAATSYDELRTVRGVTHPTYGEAARALGLLCEDGEFLHVMADAVRLQHPPVALRRLFVTIVANGAVYRDGVDAPTLLARFRSALSADYAVDVRARRDPQLQLELAQLHAEAEAEAAVAPSDADAERSLAAAAAAAEQVRARHRAQWDAEAYNLLLDDLHARFDDRGFHDAHETFGMPLTDARRQIGERAQRGMNLLHSLQSEQQRIVSRERADRLAEVVGRLGGGDNAATAARLEQMRAALNTEQSALYDAVVGAVARQEPFCGALIGSAGTGKTFVVSLAVDALRFRSFLVLCVASTGVASRMYRGGSTAHAAFGIPVDKPPYDRSVPLQCVLDSARAQHRHTLAISADMIVWDEAYAIDNRSVDAVDRLFNAAARLGDDVAADPPFGGKRVLLIGDPRQIPPVVVGTTAESAIASASLQAWRRYGALRKFVLHQPVRQAADAVYAQFCAAVGDGAIGDTIVARHATHRRVTVPDDVPRLLGDAATAEFERRVFSNSALAACVDQSSTEQARGEAVRVVSRRAIICARIADVLQWNKRVSDRLPGPLLNQYSYTQVVHGSDPGERRTAELVVNDDMEHVLELHRTRGGTRGGRVRAAAGDDDQADERHNVALYDYLRTFNVSGVPPHDLPLKAGMLLILIRNIAPQDGLTNGTKLRLLCVRGRLLEVQAFGADGSLLPEVHLLPRLWFDFYLPKTFVRVRRRQFPVVVGYAFTCHRAQCQTLDFVGLDATVDVFAHGALFVSLSRVRRAADLCVFVGGKAAQQQPQQQPPPPLQLINVVFRSLLRDVVAADEDDAAADAAGAAPADNAPPM